MKKSMIATACAFVLLSNNALAGDPAAAGDIVGRDLGSGGAEPLGHVGMYTGSGVLEVMNVPEVSRVIQVNTVASFKQATRYWGAKYGRGFNHSSMIAEGLRQKSYGGKYTYSPFATPGYVQRTCIQYGPNGQCAQYMSTNVPGEWRCDSFVNYIFKYATNESLAYFLTPSAVYDSHPYSR